MYELKVLAEPVRIEGPACVERFPTKKCKALLCYLGIAPSHRARRDAIIADLWPDEFEDVARKALRQTLYHIRATVRVAGLDPDLVRTSGDQVWLDGDLLGVDVDRFSHLAGKGLETGDAELRMQSLTAALNACPNGFVGCDDGLWVVGPRERISDVQRRVRVSVCRTLLNRAECRQAYDCAMALVAEYPYDEAAYEVAIGALLRLQDRSGARELYDRFERGIAEGLGEKPSISWEYLASSCPAAERSEPQPLATRTSAPSPRRGRIMQSLALVGMAAVLLIGGWSARGVRGPQARASMAPAEAEGFLKAAFEGRTSSAASRISAVRRLFDAAWPSAYGANEDEWAAVIRKFKDPILKTLNEARTSDPEATMVIAGAGWRYFVNEGASQGIQAILKDGLAHASHKPSRDRARALCSLAFDMAETHRPDEALPLAREALEMYRTIGDPWGIAHANRCIGFAQAFRRDWKEASTYYGRALDGFKRLGNREGMAVTQLCQGFASEQLGGVARTNYTIEALESYLAVDNQWGLEYAGDALRFLVSHDDYRGLSKEYAARAVAALEHHLALASNPFSAKSLDTRQVILRLSLEYGFDDVSSRQLEWFVRYQQLGLENVAMFYGSCGSKSPAWSWLEDRIQADISKGGKLATAFAEGKKLGRAACADKLGRATGTKAP